MQSKYCKLVLVSAENNNKFYEMTDNGTGTFNVKYGRIESTVQTGSYPTSLWDSKYREKIKKGYKDLTHTVVTEVKDQSVVSEEKLKDIEDRKVNIFLTLMKKYTDGLVASTYKVKAKDVTQVQIGEAQKYLDELMKIDKKDVTLVNSKLLELYMVIPRYMGKVQHHLLPNINLDKVLVQEQDNIDAISSQISNIKINTNRTKEKNTENRTLLDIMGIEMEETIVSSDIKYLADQCTNKKIHTIFKINNKNENKVFDDWLKKQTNKNTKIVIHGTRNSSVIPILQNGLKIRPVGNYQFSGKSYGEGSYFSETVTKSLNYTGNDQDKVLLVYEIHVGNPFVYNGWYTGNSFSLNYQNLKERGYDSTYVNAGNGLLNSEIICYKECQQRIKYIIYLK